MGGSESVDFLAPSGSGENTLVTCANGDFAADLEVARTVPRSPEFPPPLAAPEEVATPGIVTCEALADFLGIDLAATSKAMPVTKEDGTVVLALIRGDDRLELAKLVAALGEAVRPSTEEEIRAAFGADPGSLGPVGFKGEIVADETAARGAVRHGREPDRLALPRRRARPRLSRPLRRSARPARKRPLRPLRRRAHVPDRDRGRPYLQARHALLRPARSDIPRRGRAGETACDGQLRDRARPRDGRHSRTAPRRGRDSLAGRARTLRCPRARAAGSGGAGRAGRRDAWRRPAPTCCSTIASFAQARSSPTPT